MERESQATWDVRGTDNIFLEKYCNERSVLVPVQMWNHRGQEMLSGVLNGKLGEVNPEIRFDHYIIQRECTTAKTSSGVPKNVLAKVIKSDTFTKSGALS
jgi:hypothetical protein